MKTRCMKLLLVWAVVAVVLATPAQALRLGLGVNYWYTVDDINVDNFDESGLSWVLSAQMGLSDWSRLELGVERFEKGFGGSPKDVYAPQVFLVLGRKLYAAVGIGGYYTDSGWANDPFYALRAGWVMELLPSLFLDFNANYRFSQWDNLKDSNTNIGTDTVTLGAAIRLGF
ncbi:MAG TPA: hypothetical protein PKE26_10465 [Kiritimatiellia bacterium]|nr:hypothetical protein [Kiritimatiellia bacterium]HMO99520.1 hypothetical protein [Kiritimatiellia bacterium]HMP98043.1 hypothetical protein [Kiritimatiellia bacterium]